MNAWISQGHVLRCVPTQWVVISVHALVATHRQIAMVSNVNVLMVSKRLHKITV